MYISTLGLPTRQLLDLPNGLHFQNLALSWCYEEDLSWVTELVIRCSDTLECLDVSRYLQSTFVLALRCSCDLLALAPLLSTSRKQETTVCDFLACITDSRMDHCHATNPQGLTPKHRDLQRISIHIPFDLILTDVYTTPKTRRIIGEMIYKDWSDLDRFLVQFWESCSALPRVTLGVSTEEVKQNMRCCIECLFPETTKRRIIDLVGRRVPQ